MSNDKIHAFHIHINSRPREVFESSLTYQQVVALAFSNPDFSQFNYDVHYSGPKTPDGTLVDGQSLPVENGLKIDVGRSNKS
jgi:hypothetical protein